MRTLFFYLFVAVFLMGLTACVESPVRTVRLSEWPAEILAIKENNRKVPSFSCDIGFSSKTKGRRVNAEGKAFVDKKKNRVKITLFDTIAKETLLDMVLLNGKISLYLFSSKGGVIIKGTMKNLDLGNYFKDLKLELKDLINLVRGESYLFDNPDSIQMQKTNESYFYKVSQGKLTELLSIDVSSKRISKLVVYKNNRELYRVVYKKYLSTDKFYFPKRSDFYHKLSDSKTIIYLSDLQFGRSFSRKIFQLKDYPKAKELIDPN